MNAPFDNVEVDFGNGPITDGLMDAIWVLVESTGMSLEERIVGLELLKQTQYGRAKWQGVELVRGDVAYSAAKVSKKTGICIRSVEAAFAGLHEKGFFKRTRRVVGVTRVRIARVLLAADKEVEMRLLGPTPSLYLGRPKAKRSPINSAGVAPPINSAAQRHVAPPINSAAQRVAPPINSADNSSVVLSSSEFDPPSLPITHGETAGEEGDEVSIEQPDAPCVEPLPRRAAIADPDGPGGRGAGDRAHRLNHELMVLAGDLEFAWPKPGYSERLRLLQLRADPSDPRNVRTKAGDNRTHAAVALERGKLREWALRWLEDAAAQEKDGRNPLSGAAATAPTPEERAHYENHLKERAAAATSTAPTIELDPEKFGGAAGGAPDLGAMWGEMKARGVQ